MPQIVYLSMKAPRARDREERIGDRKRTATPANFVYRQLNALLVRGEIETIEVEEGERLLVRV